MQRTLLPKFTHTPSLLWSLTRPSANCSKFSFCHACWDTIWFSLKMPVSPPHIMRVTVLIFPSELNASMYGLTILCSNSYSCVGLYCCYWYHRHDIHINCEYLQSSITLIIIQLIKLLFCVTLCGFPFQGWNESCGLDWRLPGTCFVCGSHCCLDCGKKHKLSYLKALRW